MFPSSVANHPLFRLSKTFKTWILLAVSECTQSHEVLNSCSSAQVRMVLTVLSLFTGTQRSFIQRSQFYRNSHIFQTLCLCFVVREYLQSKICNANTSLSHGLSSTAGLLYFDPSPSPLTRTLKYQMKHLLPATLEKSQRRTIMKL